MERNLTCGEAIFRAIFKSGSILILTLQSVKERQFSLFENWRFSRIKEKISDKDEIIGMAPLPSGHTQLFTVERLVEPGFHTIPKLSQHFYGEHFSQSDLLVFVGSCGIAVREIAPHVRSKGTDPGVLVNEY